MARSQLLLLLFVGTLFLAISLAAAGGEHEEKNGCGNACKCPNKQSCTNGKAKEKCCWNGYECKIKIPYGCGCGSPCYGGKSCCGDKCVDCKSDKYNCGGCDKKCDGSKFCCGGKCIDCESDKYNCGGCGKTCGSKEQCCKGKCTDVTCDKYNCGRCGYACMDGKICENSCCVKPKWH